MLKLAESVLFDLEEAGSGIEHNTTTQLKQVTNTDTKQGKVMMFNNLTGCTSNFVVFHGRNWRFDFLSQIFASSSALRQASLCRSYPEPSRCQVE